MLSGRSAIVSTEPNRIATHPSAAQARALAKYLLLLIGAVVVLVTLTPLVSWWGRALAGPFDDPSGDVMIVLAAANSEDGVLSYSSYLRTEYALSACKTGEFRRVIISGGGSPPTAVAMRELLQYQGIPKGIIDVEVSSTSTHENATETAKLLGTPHGHVVLLTSDFHMYRAVRAFRKAGVNVASRPFPDVCKRASRWPGRWPAFLDLCVESVKIGYYKFRGWI